MRSAVILAGGDSRRLGLEKALLEFEGRPLICWTAKTLLLAADEVVVVAKDRDHARRLAQIVLDRTFSDKTISDNPHSGRTHSDQTISDQTISDQSHSDRTPSNQSVSDQNRVRFTWDSISGFGPVAGLEAGLKMARGRFAFATACDLPFLNGMVIDKLFELADADLGYEAAVPVQPNGYFEPLHSVYERAKMQHACQRALERGERRIHVPLQELMVNRVPKEQLQQLDPEQLSFFNLNTREDLERAQALWPEKRKRS